MSRGTVSMSACLPMLGVAELPLFGGMLIYSIVTNDGLAAYTVYGALTAIGVLLILSVNWKIEFDDNGFTYRTILRRSRRYRWCDITKICGTDDIFIFVGKRILTVDAAALNRRPFLRMLRLHARHAYRSDRKET